METIPYLIADDESLVRERLTDLMKAYPSFSSVGLCADGEATIKAVQAFQPQLLFLDIKMPKASGFDVLDVLHKRDVLVVFVTAYDQYALKAFEYAAFDYLLKPLRKDRFDKTMQRVIKALQKKQTADAYLSIKDGVKVVRIAQKDVSHLEAADNYVKVFVGDQVYRKRITLARLVSRLQKAGFIRVHRSYAINPHFVQDMVRVYQGDYLIKLQNGRIVPTSKSYRKDVARMMKT